MQIEKKDGGIRVKRELEAGYFQFVEMPIPAVLTIQSGINKLRYATLIGIKQAKNKPLRKVTFAEIQAEIGPNLQQIQRLYIPQKTKTTEMLEGTPRKWQRNLSKNSATKFAYSDFVGGEVWRQTERFAIAKRCTRNTH